MSERADKVNQEKKDRMGRMYNDLRAAGKTGPEATALINEEFKTNMTYSTVRGYGFKYNEKLKKASLHSEHDERSECEEDNQRHTPRKPEQGESSPTN